MTQPDSTPPGKLATTPLTWWLADAIDRRLTGTLVLQEPDGVRHGLYLEDGAPRKCRITAAPPHDAEAPPSEALERQLVWLFGRPAETVFRFFENADHVKRPEGSPVARVNPLALLWRCVLVGATESEVSDLVQSLGARPFVLRPEAPLDAFHFEGAHRVVVDVLRSGRLRAPDVIASGLAPPGEIARILYLLAVTHGLEATGSEAPSLAPPVPASVPPVGPGSVGPRRSTIPPAVAALIELKEDVRRRLERPAATHYEVLGVASTASRGELKRAFLELAKRFHPDRVGPALPELTAACTRLFAQMMEAFRVLSDPLERAQYDRALSKGAPTPLSERPKERYGAAVALKRAESMLTHGNLAGAERETELALEAEPDHAEVVVLWAWLQAQKPDADLRRLWARVDAVAQNVDTVLVHYYRGQFLKRLGKHASALQEFRQVLELDARHIDAAREVRLYELSRDQWLTEPPRPRSGTFSSSPSSGSGGESDKSGLLGWLKRKS